MSRSISAGLQTLLSTGQFQAAYLLRFTVAGQTLDLTTWDAELSVGGQAYTTKAVSFGGGRFDREARPAPVEIGNVGLDFSALVLTEHLDGARAELDLYFPQTSDVVPLWRGRPALQEADEQGATFSLLPVARALERDFPPNQVSHLCRWRFADGTTCQADPDEQTGVAGAGSTALSIFDSGRNEDGSYTGPGTYWADGFLTFTGGALAGLTRTVRVSDVGELTLEIPFDGAPGVGDAYVVRRGCNRTFEVCAGRFANTERFGGFVDLPDGG